MAKLQKKQVFFIESLQPTTHNSTKTSWPGLMPQQVLRFAKAMKLMEERARVPLFLTYRAVGSGTGQKEFVGQESNGCLWGWGKGEKAGGFEMFWVKTKDFSLCFVGENFTSPRFLMVFTGFHAGF